VRCDWLVLAGRALIGGLVRWGARCGGGAGDARPE